jgi:transcriptional regulator with XRE-family HTH domain
MQERTRKHLTEKLEKEKYFSISSKSLIEEACKDRPMWAIALSGLRCREALTQKQLGEIIGVKQSNISLMERGLRPIGKDIAKRLAQALNADYRIFL